MRRRHTTVGAKRCSFRLDSKLEVQGRLSVDSLPSGPKTIGRQCCLLDSWTRVCRTVRGHHSGLGIHAVRMELVLMQDLVHLATIARALRVSISKTDQKGQTCAEEDCVGTPCGQGGIFTDLWSFGGPEGSYKCECSEGYEETTTDAGKPTCTRSFAPSLWRIFRMPSGPVIDFRSNCSLGRRRNRDGSSCYT